MDIIPTSDERLRPGSNFCKCGACGAYFGGVRAFELHRGPGGNRACFDPGGVSDRQGRPLLTLTEKGYWVRAYGKRQERLLVVA